MRIAIDLQACQCGSPAVAASSLALVKAMVAHANTHDVFLALSGQFPSTIEMLRSALRGVVGPDRMVVFMLPNWDDTPSGVWSRRAAELVREGFLQGLAVDLVLVPHALLPGMVLGTRTALSSYISVLQVADSNVLPRPRDDDADALDAYFRQQALLDQGGLLLKTTYATAPSADESGAIWRALEKLHGERVVAAPKPRPRLAYVSPLPPEKSGIADYSVELVRELARFYDVDLIVDQPHVSTPWIKANLPLRSVAWFEANADDFERVMYHIGNSPAHKHMFGLMERHPGIVVVHDFYLGNVINYLDHTGYAPGAFLLALYAAHGWPALIDRQSIGPDDAVWKYPCTKAVIDQADGVIVHSAFARKLGEQWFGADYTRQWCSLPMLRGDAAPIERQAARMALGISEGEFMVCSFGMLGRTKLNDRLLAAWLASPLALASHCRLVFVGENDDGKYGKALLQAIGQSSASNRIMITGFVSHEQYRTYLAACDVAVQLRAQTRGETSAAVLDCLLHGLPTIVNAHGSLAELPDHALLKLEDEFTDLCLTTALCRLWNEPELRASLAKRAFDHVAAEHSPGQVGPMYRDAIENFVTTSSKRNYQRLLVAIGGITVPRPTTPENLLAVASAIAANLPRATPRQLFVDVSAMVQTDLKTGIQRVVRSILMALFASPPEGRRIEPVFTLGNGQPYRYARGYMQKMLGLTELGLEDAPIEVAQGDEFLGLDLFIGCAGNENQQVLADLRDRGVGIYFVVFDILPVLRPDWFPKGLDADFEAWLQTISAVSDGLVCISRAVADELRAWIEANRPARFTPLNIGWFHLGANIAASAPSFGLSHDADDLLALIRARPTFLTVGTVEPRKGHAQALNAFELLWAQGMQANLLIVGKSGWLVDALELRLQRHPELGRRLFWLTDVTDEMLSKLYAASCALLAASEGEGFGLPLIEAALHELPVIARNLPVFREVMGEHAYYFDGLTAQTLAEHLQQWMSLMPKGKIPLPQGLSWLTWAQSAQQLVNTIEHKQWSHVVFGKNSTLDTLQ